MVAALPFISNADEIATAIAALDANDPSASGTSTTFISTISQTDGVISATKSSIPTASGTTLGMVKGGGDVTISSGVITVTDNSHKHTSANISDLGTTIETAINNAVEALDVSEPAASGTSTTFIATAKQTNGVIEVTKASIPTANGTTMGMVKQGGDVTIASGVITVNDDSHNHVISNVDGLQAALDAKATPSDITSAISALDASDPAANGTATQFITSISQKDGVITATKANITAAALGLSGAMKFLGTSATAISDGATTNPITIGTTSTTVAAGNVVLYGAKEFVWTGSKWEELGNEGSYKVQQSAVSSPSASGNATAFIDSISQNAQGVITATKKNVTFPTLSGGSAAGNDVTVVGGVTVSGHAVTVGKKTLTAGSNVTITGGTDSITIAATDTDTGATSVEVTGSGNAITAASYDATTRKLTLTKGATYNNYTYSLPNASSSTLGGVKIGSNITVSSGTISLTKANVVAALGYTPPTTDTNTTYSQATSSILGLVKIGYTESGKNYPVELNSSGQMYVNVPWTDTDTTYTLGSFGITATAAELNKMDGVTATTAELNYVDGVTSNIQTQLNGKVPTSRTVNGKALSSNISLSSTDVGALPLSGGNLTGSLWLTAAGAERDLGIEYASGKSLYLYANSSTGNRGLHDTTNGTVISVADGANTFYGSATGSLSLSGGALTGNLSAKEITGTWFKTTETENLGSAADKIVVLNTSGWMYYRTASELCSDIGALPLSGGTLSGNVTIVKESGSVYVSANNTSVGKINLQVSDSGNKGIYDSTNSKWLIYSDSNNLTKVPGGQTVTEPCLRNIDCGTTALTSGSSSLTTGTIYVQYE